MNQLIETNRYKLIKGKPWVFVYRIVMFYEYRYTVTESSLKAIRILLVKSRIMGWTQESNLSLPLREIQVPDYGSEIFKYELHVVWRISF